MPESSSGLGPMFFQSGMLIILLSGLVWYVTGFIGGRYLAKRFFMWGVIILGLGMLGGAGINALVEAFAAMPTWLALTIAIIVIGFMILGVFGAFARIFMPAEAADAMTGDLAASLVRAVLVPFRGSFRKLRRIISDSWQGP